MSEGQVFAWLAFVLVGMFVGFMSGYYIGYDHAIGIIKEDTRNTEWYRWPRVKILLDDHVHDYELAREVNNWLKKNVNKRDYMVKVLDDETQIQIPYCIFYIKDRNMALTLSIKHNISYTPGYGKGYQ